jgi:hypothetical protein
MQIVPIIVVLGGVSWMVCVVSLQGQRTGSRAVWPARMGHAAHRASMEFGAAIRTGMPKTGHAFQVHMVRAGIGLLKVGVDVARGLREAAVVVFQGLRQDAIVARDWALAARARLAPAAVRTVAIGPTTAGIIGPALSRASASAMRLVISARQAQASRTAERRAPHGVRFSDSLSTTWENAGVQAPDALDLPAPPEEEEPTHHVRGVLGLVVLIAVVGFLIAAGLVSVAWALRHVVSLRGSA